MRAAASASMPPIAPAISCTCVLPVTAAALERLGQARRRQRADRGHHAGHAAPQRRQHVLLDRRMARGFDHQVDAVGRHAASRTCAPRRQPLQPSPAPRPRARPARRRPTTAASASPCSSSSTELPMAPQPMRAMRSMRHAPHSTAAAAPSAGICVIGVGRRAGEGALEARRWPACRSRAGRGRARPAPRPGAPAGRPGCCTRACGSASDAHSSA